MLTITEETWPVVTIERDAPLQMSEMNLYIAAWERWLARNEPMGVILLTQEEKPEKAEKAVMKRSNEWHFANKIRVGQQCAGIAMVVKNSALLTFLKPLATRGTKKRMGCSGQIFTDEAEARAWLHNQLAHFFKEPEKNQATS